ncbi:Rhodanese- sulfurtransferase [Ophidiomyces ophidiicola]|uniref:Rhodanese- sulfurtransferase n=1 Tax=Ophidiomyces ophidiicola TaxID=1387563 RepID=A0ACB8V000_9EURO|nr:Rhodanese- sulfurtransferase [Ophidiomyces ophidiicola]KAI1913191.1 Rhodanese- sulfurtransferase [Ophidiomyces ophidiicola]KAI1920750.1 Rhodanese- sulfurtransferase [Ophidiomyces ophidiicola]KAI1928603.1 Rhodanese- sulfurtransferase [Ophidiomyces ophidiicola]KAI1946113.1 Rhodanese- sulfurtransferase [Ophidiomyces ophidiicola]KAI1948196.1 Rhodanese- sulfurtransferase [Ophidiomyces ophidiicola]
MSNTKVPNSSSASTTQQKPQRLPVTVEKPTPYTFDLGRLMALDPNPLNLPPNSISDPATLNEALKSTARDGAQCLLNQLLTACPITSSAEGVFLSLPAPSTPLPRFKPLPTPKPPTKWELFARKKGIGKYNTKLGASETERRKKLVYDEEKGEWVPKWGYKGKNKAEDDQWLVEVDDKVWKKEEEMNQKGESIRNEGRKDRMERIRRNERKMRANVRRAGGGKSKA